MANYERATALGTHLGIDTSSSERVKLSGSIIEEVFLLKQIPWMTVMANQPHHCFESLSFPNLVPVQHKEHHETRETKPKIQLPFHDALLRWEIQRRIVSQKFSVVNTIKNAYSKGKVDTCQETAYLIL